MERLTTLARQLAALDGVTPAAATEQIIAAGAKALNIEQRFKQAAEDAAVEAAKIAAETEVQDE